MRRLFAWIVRWLQLTKNKMFSDPPSLIESNARARSVQGQAFGRSDPCTRLTPAFSESLSDSGSENRKTITILY